MEKEIYIRALEVEDASKLLQLELDNRYFSKTFNPILEDSYYDIDFQRHVIIGQKGARERDIKYSFGIFFKETDELIGTINLFQVNRDTILNSAWLGYSVGELYNGKGYATKAAKLALEFAWNELKLHRVEAGAMPANIGSVRVLEKSGFHREGLSVQNVKINDNWEDHYLYAVINPNEG